MAFLTPSPTLSSRNPVRLRSPTSSTTSTRPLTPTATAVQPNKVRTAQSTSYSRRPKRPAPVTDSRVASRQEAHHWVAVKDDARRIFERAAVAQADVARRLEARTPDTATLHRWVLRELPSSALSHPTVLAAQPGSASPSPHASSRYLVTESFAVSAAVAPSSDSLTRRWLSAVERVGPMLSTVDAPRTLRYRDAFTCKQHGVVFSPHNNVVLSETLNVAEEKDRVLEALRAKAERSVATGQCLEFCVLQSMTDPGLFKTVEVYATKDAMFAHLDGLDSRYVSSVLPFVAGKRRNLRMFKPVIFS